MASRYRDCDEAQYDVYESSSIDEPEWANSISDRGEVFYLHGDNKPSVTDSPNAKAEFPSPSARKGAKKTTPRSKNKHREEPALSHNVKFQDLPTGLTNDVTLFVDPNRHNLGRRATLCERLLGIVPGGFDSSSERSEDSRIMVHGLLPGGEAIKSGIKIGEWLQCIDNIPVDSSNISQVLSAIEKPTKVVLTLHKLAVQIAPSAYPSSPAATKSVVHLLTGDRLREKDLSLSGVPHGILYLTLDCRSENMQDKEDIVYQFPAESNPIVDVRGAFITLCHLMVDVTNNNAEKCSVVCQKQLIHVVMQRENRELLILYSLASKLSMLRVSSLMQGIVRAVKVLYGSLHSAFSNFSHHSSLNQLFTLVMQQQLLAAELIGCGTQQSLFLEPLLEVLPAARSLTLPEETKMLIHDCLNDLESGDFGEMSEVYYDLRRSYVIVGTALFYKGYLLAHHLHPEDLADITLYLRLQSILTLCQDAQLRELLVWREVFPWRRCHVQVDPLIPGYVEPEGRWFYMVVGVKNALLCVLLEAGGCAKWAEGHPTPDPFYVDQVKGTLRQMDILNVFSMCEMRLQGPAIPSLAKADWFLNNQKENKPSESGISTLVSLVRGQSSPKPLPPSPARKVSQPESILKKKSLPNVDLHRKKSTDVDQESAYTSDGSVHLSHSDRRGRRSSIGSEDSMESGGSGLFKTPKRKRNLLSVFDFTEFGNEIHDVESGEREGSLVKLTSGCDNTLFHYVHFDASEGVLVCPSQQEMAQQCTNLHDHVLYNFQLACLSIRSSFIQAAKYEAAKSSAPSSCLGVNGCLGDVQEQGSLFNVYQQSTENADSKKNQQPLQTLVSYWVIGRRITRPTQREFFVCFHDSVHQNVVEMAFKLGFGLSI